MRYILRLIISYFFKLPVKIYNYLFIIKDN